MNRTDILRKAKLISLKTKKLLKSFVAGDFKTRQRGVGFEFDQLTEYQFGADTRFIDWKSSARMNKLLIKEFIQERSRFLHVLVDMSGSLIYGSSSTHKNKWEYAQYIAGVVSMAGIYAQDFVSCAGYSDTVEFVIPPGKGMTHGFHILESLLSKAPRQGMHTNISKAVDHVMSLHKQRSLVIIITDGIDTHMESIRLLQQRHYVIVIRIRDEKEVCVPAIGFIEMYDLETQEKMFVDTKSDMIPVFLNHLWDEQEKELKRYGIGMVDAIIDKTSLETVAHMLRIQGMRL